MNTAYNLILFAVFACAIIIGVFVVARWGKSDKPIHMTGRDWVKKQNAFYWSKKR